jgi:hypothetical protein
MHSPFRKRGVILASLLALALAAALPSPAMAKPEPGAKKASGFRLFARPLGAMTINRVYCGLSSDGQICVDSTNSSTIGGGYWPKGTADQYIFNTGLQLAGVVGADGGPWAGDTTGAFFFDPKGTTQHGTQVEPIYNMASTTDYNDICNPDPTGACQGNGDFRDAAFVPFGDESANIFNPLLTGSAASRKVQASQGDVWWMSWDGDPALNAGRSHPLGVVVETRGMGWNFPAGNEDIIYFIYTFYNVTTTNPGDYVNVRPEMQNILLQKAQEFQAKNNATFGVTLPTGGYTIDDLYAAFGTDMDVASAGTNYASVNLPFALGYTYVQSFAGEVSWTFDPGGTTFTDPFFAGAGFAGIKYLKSPQGPGAIQLYSNTINGSPFPGAFNDPQNTIQLWRYLSGNISVPAGDQPCNTGNPAVSRICWINNTQPADMRFYQSSTGFSLPPGGQGSIVVAYIFAAPVSVPGCPEGGAVCGGGNVKPGNPTILGNPALMAGGVNLVDSLSGYISATDLDGSGVYEQEGTLGPEWTVVPKSLLGKSYTAQAVFDAGFLLPFAPIPPAFFLIPGNNQVTVMWQPSTSENDGDPYYSVANDPASALYDPNYRQYDVEGYRIYRGRTDNPDGLSLIASFDYAGTIFNDYDGVINPVPTCAPELNIFTDCPVAYDPVAPGVPRTVANPNNIVSPFITTKFGGRLELATGDAILTSVDTVVTGEADGGFPPMTNSGVPFVYVDNAVRNNFRYFYVVTAYDVNSWQSGPSSLESPKSATVAVTPQAPATNYENSAILSSGIYGRGVALDYQAPFPTIDATTGIFSGPMPASDAWTVGFQDFVQQVISAPGNFAVKLDSITLGSSYNSIPVQYHMTATSGPNSSSFIVSMAQVSTEGTVTASGAFNAVQIDGQLASIYGGNGNYFLKGQASMTLYGTYHTGGYGRGCVNSATGFGSTRECAYNGPRWFAGPSPQNNETKADPQAGNPANFTTQTVDVTLPLSAGWNNAGELPGVLVVHNPQSYETIQTTFRQIEGILSGAKRAADYNVYWGAAGKVDSVIDVTHNVPVPFNANTYRGGWGFLNAAAANNLLSYDARLELTYADLGCVEPFKSIAGAQGLIPCQAAAPAYVLSETAIPGPTAFITTSFANATWGAKNAPVAANPGFVMLLGGEIYQFMLDAAGTLPAAGTVWSARDYIGAIQGGNGFGGNYGPYIFTPASGNTTTPTRTFSAVGAELRANYDVVNQVNSVSNLDLTKIHTVPDPYYVTNAYEVDYTSKVIKFVNLPTQATIRIYSSSGILVRVLNYESAELGGMLDWNVRNRNNQVVASGVYFYHVESGDARYIGRMTIVNFAK